MNSRRDFFHKYVLVAGAATLEIKPNIEITLLQSLECGSKKILIKPGVNQI
jgi:hypothetical protein